MKHGSLFSGIGGFDLASEWMGWENVFHCEWNEFGQKILKHYWPNAISYGDITKTDFTIWRGQIDIITGGFPCQPYSLAGKRKGKEDERHLWPEMLRSIREIQPGWVVGENVPGIINWSGGLVFHEVQTDLEAQGYEVFPVVLPACGVNARHKRERIWFVAHNNRAGSGTPGSRINRNESEKGEEREQSQSKFDRQFKVIADNSNPGIKGMQSGQNGIYESGVTSDSKNTNKQRNGICKKQQERKIRRSGSGINKSGFARNSKSKGLEEENGIGMDRTEQFAKSDITNAGSQGLQGRQFNETSNPGGIEREGQNKRQSCEPVSKFCKGTNWIDFPTQSPLCSRDDGISTRLDGITFPKWRNESIKGYGNAIVPQVVYQIFKAIEDYERLR